MSDAPASTDRDTYLAQALSCTACTGMPTNPYYGRPFTPSPRYPTGCGVGVKSWGSRPKLMIVGQNPPDDPNRALHGAWMLHYKGEKYDELRGPAEQLVSEVVAYLGLDLSEVYAGQAFRCPTVKNIEPQPNYIQLCAYKHLLPDVRRLRPEVILSFGHVADSALSQYGSSPYLDCPVRREWRVEGRHSRNMTWVRTFRQRICTLPIEGLLNLNSEDWSQRDEFYNRPDADIFERVAAPHPSFARRFLVKDQWLATIKEAYQHVLGMRAQHEDYFNQQER